MIALMFNHLFIASSDFTRGCTSDSFLEAEVKVIAIKSMKSPPSAGQKTILISI